MKRLPKSFGSVYKLSGSRRKPYRACKLADGKYITIGYYESSAAAVQALTEFKIYQHFMLVKSLKPLILPHFFKL